MHESVAKKCIWNLSMAIGSWHYWHRRLFKFSFNISFKKKRSKGTTQLWVHNDCTPAVTAQLCEMLYRPTLQKKLHMHILPLSVAQIGAWKYNFPSQIMTDRLTDQTNQPTNRRRLLEGSYTTISIMLNPLIIRTWMQNNISTIDIKDKLVINRTLR